MTSPFLSINYLVKNIDKFQLKGSDITFQKGEITGIIGADGSGKTTLLELIMGLRNPDEGTIVRTLVSENDTLQTFKSDTGFVYDDLHFYDFGTINDLSKMMAEAYPAWDQQEFHKYTAEFGLSFSQKFRDYSSEMKMKTMLAASLAHSPKLLIMDEPVKVLETKAKFNFFKTLRQIQKKNDMSIIITSENAGAVEKFATQLLFIHHGEFVLSGRPRELKKQYKTLDIAYRNAVGGNDK